MSITSYPTYDYNPFRVDHQQFRNIPKVDLKSGEVKYNVADFESHVRIYSSAFEDLSELNSMAIKILTYMFREIADDMVRLNVQELIADFKLSSRGTVYRGLIDLLDKKFMVRKAGTDYYFINPAKIYKGSRSKWYHDTCEFDKDNNIEKIRTFEIPKSKLR